MKRKHIVLLVLLTLLLGVLFAAGWIYLTYSDRSIKWYALLLLFTMVGSYIGRAIALDLIIYRSFFFSRFTWYRKLTGGLWNYYEMTGELPGCYGGFWTQDRLPDNRYYYFKKGENYPSKPLPFIHENRTSKSF